MELVLPIVWCFIFRKCNIIWFKSNCILLL